MSPFLCTTCISLSHHPPCPWDGILLSNSQDPWVSVTGMMMVLRRRMEAWFLFLVVILSESVESISLIPTRNQFSSGKLFSLALAAENDASTFTGQLINMINAWWETEKQFSIAKSEGKIIVSSLSVIWLERKLLVIPTVLQAASFAAKGSCRI